MKTLNHILIAVCSLISIAANAQKLPNIQQGSVRAPANIKVDGKTTEWNNQYQAYNHATDIFYTVSNDDDNLYLTVQATNPAVIRKIRAGGVSFTVQPSGKKNDNGGMQVVYPIAQRSAAVRGVVVMSVMKSDSRRSDEGLSPQAADSIMMVRNTLFAKNDKWIGTVGFAGLDSLISVYNQDGIKAAGRFDNKGAFTCEIAVSLKQLGLQAGSPAKLAYHILLNGVSLFGAKSTPTAIAISGQPMSSGEATVIDAKLSLEANTTAPTDFWGEYFLAKKP